MRRGRETQASMLIVSHPVISLHIMIQQENLPDGSTMLLRLPSVQNCELNKPDSYKLLACGTHSYNNRKQTKRGQQSTIRSTKTTQNSRNPFFFVFLLLLARNPLHLQQFNSTINQALHASKDSRTLMPNMASNN